MHNLKHLYKGSLGGSVCLQCRRFATKKTHYEVLGVSKTATQKEIKSAYIELSKKYHPDTAGARSKKKFTEINEAYSVLGKTLSRREYDNKIAFEKAQTSSSNTYGPYSRPPGSGPASYPPPGYKYGQSYDRRDNRYGSDFSSSYSEEQRKRYWESPDSELRRRYEYFYGEHGEENRRRAKERAFGKKTREQEAREVRRVVIICAMIALASTIIQFIANGQIKVRSRADLNRSPSDEIKATIDQSIGINKIDKDVKDITPPTA